MKPTRAPIVFVSQTAYVGGGMEHWLGALVNGLHARGGQVVTVLLRGPRFHSPERFLARHPIAGEIVLVSTEIGLREERVRALQDCLARYEGAFVIPVGVADAADAVGSMKARGGRHRLVTCLHGHTEAGFAEARRVRDCTDIAVSVSRYGARVLTEQVRIPHERVLHIPFGVAVPVASPAERALRVAYVGRLDQSEKRVLDIVGIVERLRDTAMGFDVVGEGPARPELERALAHDIACGRVRLHGYLEPEALRSEIYRTAAALLVLSPSEGGPITAWEAMAHGVIPVVSDFLGRAEEPIWAPERNCLVFPVGDTEAAARELRSLEDVPLRARLGDAARAIPAPYTREAFVDAWLAALDRAAQLEPRGVGASWQVPRSGGRLARVPALRVVLRRLARAAGHRFDAATAGDEWPGSYG